MPIAKRQEMYVPGFTLVTGNTYSVTQLGPGSSRILEEQGGGSRSGPTILASSDMVGLVPGFSATATE